MSFVPIRDFGDMKVGDEEEFTLAVKVLKRFRSPERE
jgi:hypothetical protein